MNSLIHPELALAETPPGEVYSHPEIFKKEMASVFSTSWQFGCRADEVAEAGSVVPAMLGTEPVLFTRDKRGEIHCVSNVCRHRAAIMVEKAATKKPCLQCPYHGWTYDLDGQMRKAPECPERQSWEGRHLPKFSTQVWGPLVFARLEETAAGLDRYLGNIAEEAAHTGYDLSNYQFLYRREYTVQANWKVYVDNYLEGYHIPLIHPELYNVIDYPNYKVDTFEYYSRQITPWKSGSGNERYGHQSLEPLYYWIFPNLMLNFYPDNLSTSIVIPEAVDRTRVIFDWFVTDRTAFDDKRLQDTIQFSDKLQDEDGRICENVQKGLNSRYYVRGKYSPARENGVHHFHVLWEKVLGVSRS